MNFDEIAAEYDALFTRTEIGRRQRQVVWNYLDKHFSSRQLNIIELNCGTGEDAVYLAKMGHNVIATDVSIKMMEEAIKKTKQLGWEESVKIRQLSFAEIGQLQPEKFDLVFSNFGGLNCLPPSEIKKLADDISKLLKPRGRFVGVVMTKHCLWEQFYFLLKLDTEKAFRRSSGEFAIAGKLPTWYYNIQDFQQLFQAHFKEKARRPVGLFLPPSYLEPFFKNKIHLLVMLEKMEHLFSGISVFSSVSDHYLIDLELKA